MRVIVLAAALVFGLGAAPMMSTVPSAGAKLVNAQLDATIAAGFAANSTYRAAMIVSRFAESSSAPLLAVTKPAAYDPACGNS
jgi:hypothetical protein